MSKVNNKVRGEVETQITNAFTKRVDLAMLVWQNTLNGKNSNELRYRAARDLIEQLIGRPKMRTEIMSKEGEPFILKIIRSNEKKEKSSS